MLVFAVSTESYIRIQNTHMWFIDFKCTIVVSIFRHIKSSLYEITFIDFSKFMKRIMFFQ